MRHCLLHLLQQPFSSQVYTTHIPHTLPASQPSSQRSMPRTYGRAEPPARHLASSQMHFPPLRMPRRCGIRNMVEKAYLIFEGQPFRRFVIAVGIFGSVAKPRWALVMVDRSGVVSTRRFSFSGTDGLYLARILYVLSFGEPADIGIDDTMTVDPCTGIVSHIIVSGQTPTSGNNTSGKRLWALEHLRCPRMS